MISLTSVGAPPVVFISSIPAPGLFAVKKSMPFTFVRLDGNELTVPG